MPLRGLGAAVGALFGALLSLAAAGACQRVQRALAPTGFFPGLARLAEQGSRVVTIALILAAVAALTPAWLTPALGVLVLMAAAAVGWSVRDMLPDVAAGLVLASERRVRPGQWISGPEYAGLVTSVGLRVTWLQDSAGRAVALPNRHLMRPMVADDSRWPAVEVQLKVPSGIPAQRVREAIQEAVLLSPWSASPARAEAIHEAEAGSWRVRVSLPEARHAERFEGALREHVSEILGERA